MRKFIMWSVAGSILLLTVSVVAASWLGRYDKTPIVTTLVQQQYQRGVQAQLMTQFVDLRRLYTLSQPLNKEGRVIDARLYGAYHAFVLTEQDTTLELRFVDLRRNGDPGRLIAAFESHPAIAEVRRFMPSWSPDQSRVAFYNFVEEQHYIYDPETEQYHAIPGIFTDSPFGNVGINFWWSPDGRQVAYMGEPQTLTIVNADGENVRRLPLPDVEFFFPFWSADSQRILIGHQNYAMGSRGLGENAPIRLLDVNTMQVDEDIAEFQGDLPRWCEERWISFVHYQPDGEHVPYVLDTQADELYNLGENPVLADYEEKQMSFDQDCEYVFISATKTAPNLSVQFFTLVSDIHGNDMRQLTDESTRILSFNNRHVTYIGPEIDSYQTVYRANVDDLEHPEVILRFKPPDRFVNQFAFPILIGNSGIAVVNYPDALYRLDSKGLLPVTGREVIVQQYQGWPED